MKKLKLQVEHLRELTPDETSGVYGGTVETNAPCARTRRCNNGTNSTDDPGPIDAPLPEDGGGYKPPRERPGGDTTGGAAGR